MDEIIKFETAQRAKEKGYPIDSSLYIYHPNGRYALSPLYVSAIFPQESEYLHDRNLKTYKNCCAAETQTALARWLREKHNIHIYIMPPMMNGMYYNVCVVTNDQDMHPVIGHRENIINHEEALELGLLMALKLIKDENSTKLPNEEQSS